ncbi:unnamed protein product [Clonostachys rosea]|uniref:Heterokaryon incompatibility domain-containing protein n=1 Tax=Bionectria ochroleuca TaxID=29856 RepID=A0ABY6TQY0_BIOOC|nr:unnamed protein product [Clonostachys rosea]
MRLLHAKSEELHEFLGSQVPNYAILSHTWGDDEVLFNDIKRGTASRRRSYDKVINCCRKAIEDGLEWVWIDTCCIDKSSSAELSEAINSMYQWYGDSSVCYVYLEDVNFGLEHGPLSDTISIKPSRWFTRGWTLQELLAPSYIKFYTSEWADIGTKSSLAKYISSITLIPVSILRGQDPSKCKIAQRMSWAAGRETSRLEDQAYCLLGLFGVNMPLLYGEGSRSFIRLQEQIMRQEEDYSIFAWAASRQPPHLMRGLLASSPAEFGDSRGSLNLHASNLRRPFHDRSDLSMLDELVDQKQLVGETHDQSFQWRESSAGITLFEKLEITNQMEVINHDFQHSPTGYVPQNPPEQTSRGLRINLPILDTAHPIIRLAWIQCEFNNRLLCVPLRTMGTGTYDVSYRFSPTWLVSVDKSLLPEFKLQQRIFHPYEDCSRKLGPELTWSAPGTVRVCLEDSNLRSISFWPPFTVDENQFPFNMGPESHIVAVIHFEHNANSVCSRFRASFGIVNSIPWCAIDQDESDKEAKNLRSVWDEYAHAMPELSYTLGDRVSKTSLRSSKVILKASIHRDMLVSQDENSYVLNIGVHNFPLWQLPIITK